MLRPGGDRRFRRVRDRRRRASLREQDEERGQVRRGKGGGRPRHQGRPPRGCGSRSCSERGAAGPGRKADRPGAWKRQVLQGCAAGRDRPPLQDPDLERGRPRTQVPREGSPAGRGRLILGTGRDPPRAPGPASRPPSQPREPLVKTLVLGIESSCDETAAALVDSGSEVLSSVIASQIALLAPFRGVVPEIAARAHEAAVVPLIREALDRASCKLDDLGAVAVTRKPGLIGALLVGIAAAKALCVARGIPLVGVDHLDAHIYSLSMGGRTPDYPMLAAVVSGGHTGLYLADGPTRSSLLGCTADDAAGEAFDKAAGLLGLPYPGGPPIETAAASGKA
ncbi:MAG: hypothetical protein HY953_02965, partial [Candidatus Rokubacteria bacterium]|nr:hypothetical protein [Candidatus Rokubacteria bacterium]